MESENTREDRGLSPHKILQTYRLRNTVVHGSGVGVGSKDDYWTVWSITKVVFASFLKIVSDLKLTDQDQLFTYLLKSKHLPELLTWLDTLGDSESKAIAKSIRNDL